MRACFQAPASPDQVFQQEGIAWSRSVLEQLAAGRAATIGCERFFLSVAKPVAIMLIAALLGIAMAPLAGARVPKPPPPQYDVQVKVINYDFGAKTAEVNIFVSESRISCANAQVAIQGDSSIVMLPIAPKPLTVDSTRYMRETASLRFPTPDTSALTVTINCDGVHWATMRYFVLTADSLEVWDGDPRLVFRYEPELEKGKIRGNIRPGEFPKIDSSVGTPILAVMKQVDDTTAWLSVSYQPKKSGACPNPTLEAQGSDAVIALVPRSSQGSLRPDGTYLDSLLVFVKQADSGSIRVELRCTDFNFVLMAGIYSTAGGVHIKPVGGMGSGEIPSRMTDPRGRQGS